MKQKGESGALRDNWLLDGWLLGNMVTRLERFRCRPRPPVTCLYDAHSKHTHFDDVGSECVLTILYISVADPEISDKGGGKKHEI